MTVYDDEIDLRPYIYSLIRNWWKIVIVAAVIGIAALLYSFLQPHKYASTATVLIVKSQPVLSLAGQMPTVNSSNTAADATARLTAFLTLAKSDSMASQVIQAMGSELPEKYREIKKIQDAVEVTNQGDLLLITATAESPDLATKIANAWASETIGAINQAYSPDKTLPEIQSQKEVAQKEYDNAQAALESFLKTSQVDLLNQQIGDANALLARLTNDHVWQINFYSQRKQDMQSVIEQAKTLKQQLASGNQSKAGDVGDALAVLNARATALGLYQQPITTITDPPAASGSSGQINTDNTPRGGLNLNLTLNQFSDLLDSSANYAADLDTIIQQAQTTQTDAEKAIENLVNGTDPESAQIQKVSDNINSLKTQLEQQNSQQRELTGKRDVAWNAYQALFQKETELTSAPQNGNEVNLAASAMPPQEPVSRNTLRNTVFGGIAGGVLGVLIVLALTWWKSFSKESPEVLVPARAVGASED